ncbi:MAG: aldolase/citrate lyase family protein [Brevinematia bacterium]
MFGIEKQLFEQLLILKDVYHIEGVKAEFEAEGSTFNDLVRLRRLTEKAGVKLFLKIGGVEAVRDIKDSLELGVDGLIAPMVETAFGLKKFLSAYKSIYKDHRIKLSINIETRNAIEELDEILEYAKNEIDNITMGRTDLSASYMDKNIKPDSDFIMGLIEEVGKKCYLNGFSFTVGGSISTTTIGKFKENPALCEYINSIETRKVVMSKKQMLFKDDALEEALRFEELYILSKKEISNVMVENELARLEKLEERKKKDIIFEKAWFIG